MSDAIKALEALRSAALDASQYEHLTVTVSRAIAALRAEQPAPAKACSGFVCKNGEPHANHAEVQHLGIAECRCRCGQPYSAHQPSEQPARQHCTCAFENVAGEYPCAVHGEPAAPIPYGHISSADECQLDDDSPRGLGCSPRGERGRANLTPPPGPDTSLHAPKVEVPPMPEVVSAFTRGQLGTSRMVYASECETLHAAAVALAERCEQVEQERDKANAALEELDALRRKESGRANEAANRNTRLELRAEGAVRRQECAERERDEARAELAALKAQHEAAVREARASERETCETACLEQRCERGTPWDRAVLACVAAIRALGEEGGK